MVGPSRPARTTVPTSDSGPVTATIMAPLRAAAVALRGSDTAKAAGLAGAMVANNVIALGSVIVFSRELSDYGSLAALVSYFLILAVVGYAMQLATAREAVLGHLGVGPGLAATIRSWTRSLLVFTAVMTVVSVLRAPSDRIRRSASSRTGPAALGIPAGCLYLLLCMHTRLPPGPRRLPRAWASAWSASRPTRLAIGGVLGWRSAGRYRRVHRHAVVVRGDDVLLRRSRCEIASVRRTLSAAQPSGCGPTCAAPGRAIVALGGRSPSSRTSTSSRPSTASATDLASSTAPPRWRPRSLIWVAMGAGFYLVPEVSRRHAAGEDPRPGAGPGAGDRRGGRGSLPADLRGGLAPADQAGLRREPSAGRRRAVHPRGRLHRAGGDVSRRAVHAGAQAQLVPAPARRGRGGRADPPAPRLTAAEAVRAGRARRSDRSRRWSPSGWRCARQKRTPSATSRKSRRGRAGARGRLGRSRRWRSRRSSSWSAAPRPAPTTRSRPRSAEAQASLRNIKAVDVVSVGLRGDEPRRVAGARPRSRS